MRARDQFVVLVVCMVWAFYAGVRIERSQALAAERELVEERLME